MGTSGEGVRGLDSGMNTGLCASIAALIVALDEADALHRERYEDILKHFWVTLPDDLADGDAGAVIEEVLELVDRYARDQTGCSIDVEDLKRSLTDQVSGSNDHETISKMGAKNRSSKHAPLLGAPFVV